MYSPKVRRRRKFRWDKILRQAGILLIIIFALGIIGSVAACEFEQISILQMIKQITICAAGIFLTYKVGIYKAFPRKRTIKNSLHCSPRQAMQTISPKG